MKSSKPTTVSSEDHHDAYMVIQEGGSSLERYVHSSESMEMAEEFRQDCARSGYRTSDVIVIPAALAAHGEELYELLDTVVCAELEYAE